MCGTMKKIIFTPIPMQQELKALYGLTEETAKGKKIDTSSKIYFPINSFIFDYLEDDDELKICFIELSDEQMDDELKLRYKENEGLFKKEIETLAKPFNAKIEYKTIRTRFTESADIFGNRFTRLYECLEKNCEIFADITFGAKTNTLILYNILNFAEQFCECNVEAIVYGKTIFVKDDAGKSVPKQSVSGVYDVTSLYYLTRLTNHINADTPDEAIKKIKKYLQI